MNCLDRTSEFQAWSGACRSLSHPGWLPASREPDPAIASAESPALPGSLSRLSRRPYKASESASFWTRDLRLRPKLTALTAPRFAYPSGPTRDAHSL